MDLQTGEYYCSSNKHTHRGSCQLKPLRQVMLLGNVLKVHGTLVTLCGQPKCGRPMVMNARSVTNMRGLSCCYCSQRLQGSIHSVRELIAYYQESTGVHRRCLFCQVDLLRTNVIYVYPMRSYVCRKHHSLELALQVAEFCKQQESETNSDAEKRVEMEAFMIDFINQRLAAKYARLARAASKGRKIASIQALLK